MHTESRAVYQLLLASAVGAGLATATLVALDAANDDNRGEAPRPCQCGSGVHHQWTSEHQGPSARELVHTSQTHP